MKLLKLVIGDLPKEKQFRSLHSGFKVEFRSLDINGTLEMESFSPFCFAGLNGSGKSNVLEALAAIFYHIECCVAKFKPKTFEEYFKPEVCNPDAFTLDYLIGRHSNRDYLIIDFFKITIKKEIGKAPRLYRQRYPFSDNEKIIEESIVPPQKFNNQEPAPGKIYLPDIIIGYSSGENEILSLPFRKSRLINFDKYKEDFQKGRPFEEPENSLIYIDKEMSQAVLLACLLYEDKTTLAPLKEELGIVGLRSFRMNLNIHSLFNEETLKYVSILEHVNKNIENLKKCASCWQEYKENIEENDVGLRSVLTLDFFVDSNTKKVFKDYFTTSFELFRFFQVLYELNAIVISESVKDEVYKSKGFYTDSKLPTGSPAENVFYFLEYLILKEIEGESQPLQLLLREFSDGEHQFLHTIGICLMLKDRRSLLLLDEPETHFNPSWRAKFIKILDDSIIAGNDKNKKNERFNVHLLKDIILTSHSPFIISDCMPNNVIIFEKKNDGKLLAKNATELGISTYGTSVNLITSRIFKSKETIGKLSMKKINDYRIRFKNDENIEALIDEINEELGDSIEKLILIKEMTNKIKE